MATVALKRPKERVPTFGYDPELWVYYESLLRDGVSDYRTPDVVRWGEKYGPKKHAPKSF